MKKLVTTLLALSMFPFAASAEETFIKCESAYGLTTADVILTFPGTYSDLYDLEQTPASALVKNLVIQGRRSKALTVGMTGIAQTSAKGPYFELVDLKNKKNTLFLSAAASNSPSELVIQGKKIDLNCN